MNSRLVTSEKVSHDNGLDATGHTMAPIEARQQLVRRMVASVAFRKSARLRNLLLYLAGKALADPPQEVTEAQIGLEVFSRRSFHPGEDSIVRVTTRQLRARVEEYFRTEGAREPLALEIPKGCYTVVFRERTPAEAAPGQTVPDSRPRPRFGGWNIALGLVCAAAIASAVALWLENRSLRRTELTVPPTLVNTLLISPGQRTVLVAADSGHLLLQKMRGRESSLQEYIGRKFQRADKEFSASPALFSIAEHLEKVAHTGAAEMGAFTRVLKQNPAAAARIEVRHAREMNVRDFRRDNYLILGAARANPWCALFEENTAFHTYYDPRVGEVIVGNRDPRPGEPAFWGNAGAEKFTHVAVVPSPGGEGRVLLAAGTSMSAKEAGGDFVTDPEVPARLARAFGVTDLRQLRAFEVVLRTRSLDGTPQGWEIVASRKR